MSVGAAKAAIAASQANSVSTESRAKALVNPTSGLANDYLNIFNELVMLVELLPDTPEFAADILAWRPRSYTDYFSSSSLPGSQTALEAFEQLDKGFRKDFDAAIADLDRIATGSVAMLRRLLKKDADAHLLAAQCAKASAAMRVTLSRASDLIDHGRSQADDNAQRRADRLLEVRIQAVKDVADFHQRPRF